MKITKVRVIERYALNLNFEDGVSGTLDLGHLVGKGVFKAWKAPHAFEQVSIGSGGELVWECGVDLCADALYLLATGKSPDALYPALSSENRCA
jgi:hypothetical protein